MPERILVVAPHPDDETLGMGGTIAKRAEAGQEVAVLTVAEHAPPICSEEKRQTTLRESREAHEHLGVTDSTYLGYAALTLEELTGPELNTKILEAIRATKPSEVYIPFYDRNSDHRAVFEAAMIATRPVGGIALELVAAYETLSSTHGNVAGIEPVFAPNLFEDITPYIDRKVEAMDMYKSQSQAAPGPRSLEAIRALAAFRGSISGSHFAEGFQVVRMNR